MRFFVLLLAVRASGLAVRLNKLLPGLSRRKADAAIVDGRVTVDGVVADGRTPVERGSEVCLDGEPQGWEAREAAKADLKSSDAFLYLKYWKPAGVTCTSDRNDASNVIARGGFDDRAFYDLFDTPREQWHTPVAPLVLEGSFAPFDAWLAKDDRTQY